MSLRDHKEDGLFYHNTAIFFAVVTLLLTLIIFVPLLFPETETGADIKEIFKKPKANIIWCTLFCGVMTGVFEFLARK
jgi:hypothetical protein